MRKRDAAPIAGIRTEIAPRALDGQTGKWVSKVFRAVSLMAAPRMNSARTIGLVSDVVTSTPFANAVIRGALDAARARGHLLIITETGGDQTTESETVRGLLDRQVDAIIYATMYTRYITPPQELSGHRVVLSNCLAPGFGAPSVIPDEALAGRIAGQVLVAAGHKDDIWAIGGHRAIGKAAEGAFAGNERMRGLQDVLRAAGTFLKGVIECEWDTGEGYQEVRGLLRKGRLPRALVCANDRVALGAYQALAEAGLAIPGEVSVISFDDQDLASWLRPALTTLALPHYELGRLSVELALREGALPTAVYRLPLLLRERASVSRPTDGFDGLPFLG